MLQWAVTIGRMDIMHATMVMSRFRAAPRKGHLERVKRIFGCLRHYDIAAIHFNISEPDYSGYKIPTYDWSYTYQHAKEDVPTDAPTSGKPNPQILPLSNATYLAQVVLSN